MNKAYNRINWENYPSVETPLNEANLNKMDASLDEVDNRVISLDTSKATKTEVATLVADVSFVESTGIITITKKNGSKITIDTKMEKIAVNFTYDKNTQQIILTLIDGTKQYIDLSALITQYEFLNSDTITFAVQTDGKIKAEVIDGSITESKMESSYLAQIKVETEKSKSYMNSASSYATNAKSWAIGGTGTRDGEDNDNSKYYSEQSLYYKNQSESYAENAVEVTEEVNKKLELASFDLDDNGNLVYTDNSSYTFTVNDDGYLNWETLTNGGISENLNFSTEEQVVGKWIDEKNIYQRTFSYVNTTTYSDVKIQDLPEDLDMFVDIFGVLRFTDTNGAKACITINYDPSSSGNFHVFARISGDTPGIYAWCSFEGTIYCTIQYTKSTYTAVIE